MTLCICIFLFSYVYEDSDSLIVMNDSLVICGYHHYNLKVEVTDNGKLKIRQWNGSDSMGWLCLEAPLFIVHDSSNIVGTALGSLGGTNSHPDGYGTGYGHAGDLSGGSGGGAGYGGEGGAGSDVGPGAGGIAYGSPTDTIFSPGSGGGAGRLSAVDGFGGNGGAGFYAKAVKIVIDTANVMCNGKAGDEGSLEAGGGGSGGSIMIKADTVLLHDIILSANGGAGGNAEFGGGGGAGGGRVKVFYTTTLDTANLVLSCSGGIGGIGGYGNGESGSTGSIYIAPLVGVSQTCEEVFTVFSVQPNPAKGTFQINSEKVPKRIQIYDIVGRLVVELKLSKHTEHVDIGGLESGVYFLKDAESPGLVIKIVMSK